MAGLETFTVEMNKFADLTETEFAAKFNMQTLAPPPHKVPSKLKERVLQYSFSQSVLQLQQVQLTIPSVLTGEQKDM